MIKKRVQKLHLLEEYNDKILDRRCDPLHTAKVQEMKDSRKCPTLETLPQVPEVNDCSSSVEEEVAANKDNKYKTRYGRGIRRPK